MTNDDLFTTLLRSTFTKADFSRRIDLLRGYFEKTLYSTEQNLTLSDFLKENQTYQEDANIFASIAEDFASTVNRENAPALILELKNRLKALPELTLYLAYPPNQDEITRLGMWSRQNINSQVLIDVRIDKNAVPGCALVWKGIHHDYTLGYFMEKNREKVLKHVSSFSEGPAARHPSDAPG